MIRAKMPCFPDYTIIKRIGEGSYAVVYKAIHVKTGILVAMKLFAKSSTSDPVFLSVIRTELEMTKQIDHSLLVTVFDVIENEDYIGFTMEYLEKGTILEYINSNRDIPAQRYRRFFQQLICGVDFLHSTLHMVHRDIKSENILLDDHLNIRLIDFGFSKFFNETNPLKTACGSPAYSAPELFTQQTYTESVDVWSLGVVLFAMATNTLPFVSMNISVLIEKIKYEPLAIPNQVSPSLADLLRHLLDKNPKTRITIPEIKMHPWFRETEMNIYPVYSLPSLQIANSGQIDLDILQKMRHIKIDVDQMIKDYVGGKKSPSITVYRIFRRQKGTFLLFEKMQAQKTRKAASMPPISNLHNPCDSIGQLIAVKIRRNENPPHLATANPRPVRVNQNPQPRPLSLALPMVPNGQFSPFLGISKPLRRHRHFSGVLGAEPLVFNSPFG